MMFSAVSLVVLLLNFVYNSGLSINSCFTRLVNLVFFSIFQHIHVLSCPKFRLFDWSLTCICNEIFTDEGDVVIDPCAGSGTTSELPWNSEEIVMALEIKKDFCKRAKEEMLVFEEDNQLSINDFIQD